MVKRGGIYNYESWNHVNAACAELWFLFTGDEFKEYGVIAWR